MGFLIFGIIVIVLGVVLWILKGKKENKLAVINEFEQSTIKMVRENYDFIEGGYGKGNFSNYVEVNGYASHGEPLIAEFSGIECVYYHSKVVEEFEEEQAYTDQNGKRRYRWVRNSRVVQDIERKLDFDLDDETGLIFIELDGADFSKESVYSDYEQGKNPDFSRRVKSGSSGFLDSLLSGLSSGGRKRNGTRILGYKYTEEAIPINSKLYVIGEANDRNGELTISAPKDKSKPYIISLKSEEQLVKAFQKKIQLFKLSAIACFVIGLGLVAFGALYSPSPSNSSHTINDDYQDYDYDNNEIEDFDSEYY